MNTSAQGPRRRRAWLAASAGLMILSLLVSFLIWRDRSAAPAPSSPIPATAVTDNYKVPESREGTAEPSTLPPAPNNLVSTGNQEATAQAPVVAQEEEVAPATSVPPVRSNVDPEVAQRELFATRRMVAAHAPLRMPSVADPDSVENQRILQTMVLKALAQQKPQGAQTPATP